jgi:hypothetical protein
MDLAAKGHIANVQVRVPRTFTPDVRPLIYTYSTSVQKYGAP